MSGEWPGSMWDPSGSMNKYTWKPVCTESKLRRLYEKQMMTQIEIARELGCTLKPVQTAMRHYGIKPRRQVPRNQWGANNASWRGDAASYQGLHLRQAKRFGRPKKCEECGTTDPKKSYDWASMSGRYEDPKDYKRLCRSCHFKMDNIIKNLRNAGY